MKPGDLVTYKRKSNRFARPGRERIGLFVGMRKSKDYEYAEVIWFHKLSPNGDRVSSVSSKLIEAFNESR